MKSSKGSVIEDSSIIKINKQQTLYAQFRETCDIVINNKEGTHITNYMS